MSTKNATGCDNISVKMLKIASPVVTQPLTDMINRCIDQSIFPGNKKTQIVPIHKKNSILDKSNYRPVSLLPVMSKVFERAFYEQLMSHFDNVLTLFLVH